LPQRDIYHDAVKNALIKDGWTITHDPLILPIGGRNVYVDIGAEAPIAAEKDGRRIAVEIKSFIGVSAVTEFERAMGQFVIYRSILAETEPDRILYLAITREVYEGIFSEPLGRLMIEQQNLRLLIFDVQQEVIIRWIE
jgi:hypothetical protein